MKPASSPPLMGPNQLIAAIDGFSSDVTRYLLPVICYIGDKNDEFLKPLQRYYPGAIQLNSYTGEDAQVTIFNHIPHDLLGLDSPLSPDSSYIFLLDDDLLYTEQELDVLYRLNAVTLVKPDPSEALWQIRTQLMVQNMSYANNRTVFPSLISADLEYRDKISKIIRSVIHGESLIVSVSSIEVRQALFSFLFDFMPSSIRPHVIRGDNQGLNSLPSDRLCLIDGPNHSLDDVVSLYQQVSDMESSPSIMTVLIGEDLSDLEQDSDINIETATLRDLSTRTADAHLLSYCCSAQQSHTIHKMCYHSIPTVNKTSVEAIYCPDQYLSLLRLQDARNVEPGDILTELTDTFDRLSIDSIMSEVERMVMIKLRDQCKLAESASYVAGIPRVTYNKRSKRHSDRQSLLSFFSKS